MRFLFLGDVVGRSGRKAVVEALPKLRAKYALDFVVVNGENAAGGFGITEAITEELLDAGADCITLGNHAFDQKDTLVFIDRQPRLIRPLNYPKGTPGRGVGMYKAKNGADVLVINALGRIFMTELDCPFRAIDAETTACKLKKGADAIFVDFHAEATSEKQGLAYFLDGRVSGVAGTHTHSPTADNRVLPHGTVAEVREEVRRVIQALGPGGGCMLGAVHTVMNDVPPENVLAMVDAVEEFGYYPLQ